MFRSCLFCFRFIHLCITNIRALFSVSSYKFTIIRKCWCLRIFVIVSLCCWLQILWLDSLRWFWIKCTSPCCRPILTCTVSFSLFWIQILLGTISDTSVSAMSKNIKFLQCLDYKFQHSQNQRIDDICQYLEQATICRKIKIWSIMDICLQKTRRYPSTICSSFFLVCWLLL